jgi:hypothetical protein
MSRLFAGTQKHHEATFILIGPDANTDQLGSYLKMGSN